MPHDQQNLRSGRGWGVSSRGRRVISGFAGAAVLLGAAALAAPAQAVANPVHAVAGSSLITTRGSDFQMTFSPSPAGSVNGIFFDPPPGMTITNATGCDTTAGLPTNSTYTCTQTAGFAFTAQITLSVHVDSAATAGTATGFATVKQTDNTTVSDGWTVRVDDIGAYQQGVPITANGSTGSTAFNPSIVGSVGFVVFQPPPGVTITGATGCPQPSALPTTSQFVCLSGAQTFDTKVTLTYTVDPSASVAATLAGAANVGQLNGSTATTPFNVSTPAGATKVTAVRLPQPSAYGQSSTVTVTVARDGNTGSVPTGTVQLVNAAGTQVGSTQVLFNGAATFALPATMSVGTQTLTAKYSGSDSLAASQAAVTVSVTKAATKTKAKASTSKPKYKADFKVKVTVKAAGVAPSGKVRITYKGKVIAKGKVKGGKATLTIKKDLKIGKRKLVVKYLGSATTLASKGKVVVTIVKG